MNLRDVDQEEVIRLELRELQGRYPREHQALINWGRWSRDRRGIYPAGVTAPSIWQEAPSSKWEFEEPEAYEPYIPVVAAQKGDRPETEDYDEKTAVLLDERIHGYGGLNETLRSCLEVAYLTRTVQENRFHRLCTPPTTPSGFRERLTECLVFVGRWI
jgi:hypothetical protein